MTDDDRIFALADMRFPSLDALHAWFNAQIAGTKDEDEKVDLRLADRIATERHIERAKAAANAPIPSPPPAPKPPPEPLPADATDEERAARLYGPSLTKPRRTHSAQARNEVAAPVPGPGTFQSIDDIERYFGRLRKAAGDDAEKVRELQIEEGQAKEAFLSAIEREREAALAAAAAEDEAARAMYGEPIGVGLGATKNPRRRKSEYPPTPGDPV